MQSDYAGYPHALEHRELYLHWQLYVTFNEDTQCKCRNTACNFSWLWYSWRTLKARILSNAKENSLYRILTTSRKLLRLNGKMNREYGAEDLGNIGFLWKSYRASDESVCTFPSKWQYLFLKWWQVFPVSMIDLLFLATNLPAVFIILIKSRIFARG